MSIRVLEGDCRDVLKSLPDESVHCVVTSPPYFGLRDYGHAGQIGLEPTPDEFVAALVGVFREVRRVLRDDGTVWLNLGDSYASAGGSGQQGKNGQRADRRFTQESLRHKANSGDAKPKDLIGIPWRVAFALKADGWYLRQDIIWAKPNPMPESVRDRCTKAHEYIFLLAKSERYYYDADAIAEPLTRPEEADRKTPAVFGGAIKHVEAGKQSRLHSGNEYVGTDSGTRNKRSVWTVSTKPFSGAHFATFPPDLIEPCILAGTSAHGACAKCGAPWVRQLEERAECAPQRAGGWKTAVAGIHNNGDTERAGGFYPEPPRTTGWATSCACAAPVVPCAVLDPFGGAGTTGLVADRHHRDAILIELNPEYAAMARTRIAGDAPLFSEVA